MSTEFDYQWKNLPSKNIEYNELRIQEFLDFTGFDKDYLQGKEVLDAGCGSGRYTYAMQELGANVDSIDISEEAVAACCFVNPYARQLSIFDLYTSGYDFILCWGVLHHTNDPKGGFNILTDALKVGGRLHLMLYCSETQKRYIKLRQQFALLDNQGKVDMCKNIIKKRRRGNIHGWFDALNPEYNHSYSASEIGEWFKESYTDVQTITTSHININGEKT